jgi:hypothetical protein
LDYIAQEATMMIKVEGGSNNYRAFVDDEPDLSATDRTIDGAIGRLVQIHPDKLRLTIDLGGCQPSEYWGGFPRGHYLQQPTIEDFWDESDKLPGDERG